MMRYLPGCLRLLQAHRSTRPRPLRARAVYPRCLQQACWTDGRLQFERPRPNDARAARWRRPRSGQPPRTPERPRGDAAVVPGV